MAYGSPQIGYHSRSGPPRRRRLPRWLRILLITIGVIVGGYIAIVVVVAILIAAHVVPQSVLSPSATPTLESCSPPPCAASHGLVLLVSGVERNWQPPPPIHNYETKPTPKPGFHFVRLQVAFNDVRGEHHVSPLRVLLEDPLGYAQPASIDYENFCGAVFDASTTLAPGGSTKPTALCYDVGGPVDGKLTLLWTPDASRIGDQCFTQQFAVVDCAQATIRVTLPK